MEQVFRKPSAHTAKIPHKCAVELLYIRLDQNLDADVENIKLFNTVSKPASLATVSPIHIDI
jgi:hypothetical protein